VARVWAGRGWAGGMSRAPPPPPKEGDSCAGRRRSSAEGTLLLICCLRSPLTPFCSPPLPRPQLACPAFDMECYTDLSNLPEVLGTLPGYAASDLDDADALEGDDEAGAVEDARPHLGGSDAGSEDGAGGHGGRDDDCGGGSGGGDCGGGRGGAGKGSGEDARRGSGDVGDDGGHDADTAYLSRSKRFLARFHGLNRALCEVVQDYSLVSFVPLSIKVWRAAVLWGCRVALLCKRPRPGVRSAGAPQGAQTVLCARSLLHRHATESQSSTPPPPPHSLPHDARARVSRCDCRWLLRLQDSESMAKLVEAVDRANGYIATHAHMHAHKHRH
jgi:hypothetical protein